MIRTIIVDDEQIVLQGLRETINWEHYGIKIVGIATSGKQALEMLHKQPVDLLLIDIIMSGMSGLELLGRIQEEAPSVVAVMISCHASFDFVQQALRKGAVDYLVKTELEEDQLDQNLTRISRKVQRILSAREQRKNSKAAEEQRERKVLDLLRETIWFVDRQEYNALQKACSELPLVSAAFQKKMAGKLQELEQVYRLPPEILCVSEAADLADKAGVSRYLERCSGRAMAYFLKRGYREEIVCSVLRAVNYLVNCPQDVANQTVLCEKFSISRSYFSKVFPDLLGTSFQEYIQQVRIDTAKRLIRTREVPLDEIASRVGLEDTKYFNKMFQKATGMTLAAWQKKTISEEKPE